MVMANETIDWRRLAAQAMRRRAAFEKLLLILETTLARISKTHCPLDPEAGAQEARLRLFHLVYVSKSVDIKQQPSSIRAYLIHAASQEMTKQQKRLARHGMYGWGRGGQSGRPIKGETRTALRPAVLPLEPDLAQPDIQPMGLPWPIPLYALYYKEHGTLDGAAEEISQANGLNPLKLEKIFRREIAKIKQKRFTASLYPFARQRVIET